MTAKKYCVNDAIEAVGFGRFQIILSFCTGLSWMADSMEIMLLSMLSPALVCEWGISPYQQALGTTCVFIGWMVFSPIWGWFCDRFGRKTGLFFANLMGGIFGVATAFAPSFTFFVIARGCVGMAMGGVPQSATLYAEFLPTAHRAKCIILLELFWAMGSAFEALLALIIMPIWGWRALVVASSMPLFLFTLCCIWIPESPRFLVSHHKTERAGDVLQRIAKCNKAKLPEGVLVPDFEPGEGSNKTITALLSKGLRMTTLLLWVIWMMNAFSYYGMSLYTTKLFQSTDTCHGGSPHNGISVNNSTSTENPCIPLRGNDYLDILATSFSEVPGLLLTMLIIERIGRRLTIGLQFFVFALANYVLYFCLSRNIIVCILFVARALIAGAFQATYVYTPEVYPTTVRALAIGTASMFARIGAMVTPYVAQVIANYNIVYATLIYGTSGIIGALCSILLPIETAGREMTEIYH